MVTVGFDFGTHQTKICCESMESGTTFYEVFRFACPNGEKALTLPSFVRLRTDGTLRYGHDALADDAGGQAVTYFKQKMFSLSGDIYEREEAECWSVLYLTFIIFKLDEHFHGSQYNIQMGMPTDADPQHYFFCKWQALKVMSSAMLIARNVFHGNLMSYLNSPYTQLLELVKKCLSAIPHDVVTVQRNFPILVFPEAYVTLIPLINEHKLPTIGPNLFVDIGGGTVDISFFTNQMDMSVGKNRPCLYHYHSIPYGLNMITGQDLKNSHNVEISQNLITHDGVSRFHCNLMCAVDGMMDDLRMEFEHSGRSSVMPFANLCSQILDGRPICYSGGGSMFPTLRRPVARATPNRYNFSYVTTVSDLIDHSKLYVKDKEFYVLANAFALSHSSLINRSPSTEPDSIRLVSVARLFDGVKNPGVHFLLPHLHQNSSRWERKKSRNW